ncbi:MAG TPA: response regulator [Terriglobales bacterium]|nr:response regulator [Terriglobales bacterium]
MPETAARTATAPALPVEPADIPLAYHGHFIGQLASTMANQLNNILMAVTSSAELELRKAQPSEKQTLEQILNNAARATSLIQTLLVFSRKHSPSPQPVRLNALVTETGTLIRHLAGEQAELSFRLAPQVQRVIGDDVEIQKLLLGLALNAAGSGGKVSIATDETELGAEFLAGLPDACPGRFVVLSVEEENTPPAGPEYSADQAGDAAFRVQATMAAAGAIARAAGGLLQAGEPGGTNVNFKIFFPEWGHAVPEERAQTPAKAAPSATILIVEDDDGVRLPAAEFLKMEGYKILQARTGPEALHIALRNRSALDLLITDIVMPEMGGHEVAARLLEMHPELKVLYMSGDPNQSLIGQVVEEAQNTALQKPFSLKTLHHRIKELLS